MESCELTTFIECNGCHCFVFIQYNANGKRWVNIAFIEYSGKPLVMHSLNTAKSHGLTLHLFNKMENHNVNDVFIDQNGKQCVDNLKLQTTRHGNLKMHASRPGK